MEGVDEARFPVYISNFKVLNSSTSDWLAKKRSNN